jgi:4-amino-4-deoxy-L-arabinose transferase-like glycosyltransferase
MVISFGLHIYNIESIGDANAYYTAAVKSMLQSWSNFFFVAAEPGGSVTVDKPPLGLWIEAAFAFFLGVSGFSSSLPNILAGVFGIPLLYAMVKKYMGELAGIVSAFVMTITPIFIATNRNNTMDGLLIFFLLAAAWTFIRATETGKLRWVLAGAFIVGLGFNIKMMQAFLPLPAFYALYFLGSKEGWLRKIINLGLATILLLAVSLSWAVAVDLTPADQHPYIGSSSDNTVMGLIFGHNGLSRLESAAGGSGQEPPSAPGAGTNLNQESQPRPGSTLQGPPQEALDACAGSAQDSACSFTPLNGNVINGACITPPNLEILVCAPQGTISQGQNPPQPPNAQGGGLGFSQETGAPGIFRFFTQPLSKQMSWLLPFALIGILLVLPASRIKLPIESNAHKALILWGGWLLTCVVFFSAVSGIFHAYYAAMLAPALGAMVGIGLAQLWSWGAEKRWIGGALALSAVLTLGFQYFAAAQYNETSWWFIGGGFLLALGILLLFVQRRLAYATILAAMMIVPAYWTVKTVETNANQNLPSAYAGGVSQSAGMNPAGQNAGINVKAELLAYLETHTQDVKYLVAVPSAQSGASFVLATGRPVLYMGGFSGSDEVVNANDLSRMVAAGELRYVLYGGGQLDIVNWLTVSCSPVQEFSDAGIQAPNGRQGQENQRMELYQCE